MHNVREYHVHFLVLYYVIESYDVQTQLISVWSRESYIEQTDLALDIGVRCLDFFEEYFDIGYPLPKQDMIALPDFKSGAMENWGLITYRSAKSLLLSIVSLFQKLFYMYLIINTSLLN